MYAKETSIIKAGQYVLVRLPSSGLKIIEVRPGGIVSLGKFGCFEVDGIIGYPLGQSFEVQDDKTVIPIQSMAYIGDKGDPDTREGDEKATPEAVLDVIKSSESNQNIIDIGSKIQKLSSDDIEILKRQQGGEEIIHKIIESHAGFDLKTKFSQEKYLKRKQAKFLRRFTIEYMGSSELLQYYIEKDINKVLGLSIETLGYMINLADIRPGGKYLLVDETGGVVLYAMMERMRGEGTIVLVHENEHPNTIAMSYSNFPDSLVSSMVRPVNWLQFFEPEAEKLVFKEFPEEEYNNLKDNKKEQYHRRKTRAAETNKTMDMCQEGGFDALVYCSTTYPVTLVPKILDSIGGSRPIVVYSQYKEVVLEMQHAITKDLRIVNPNIYSTNVRPYQTIPGRIHPLMTMRGHGGYVMWATKVIPKEGGITAVGRGFVRKNERKRQAAKLEAESVQDEEEQKKAKVETSD